MMKAKRYILFLFTFFSCGISAQNIVFQDANYVVHYKLIGDTVRLTVESLGDNSLELDNDGTLDVADDFVQLMWDQNASGGIDFGNQIDLYYQYDSTQTNNLCVGHITGPSTKTSCGTAGTNGYASVKLGASVYSATSHVIYDFTIPRVELDYDDYLCANLSVKIHNGGEPLANTKKVPSSSDTYFVGDGENVKLYPDVDLGDDINACVGDTVWANYDYPFYFWNTTTTNKYVIVVNYLEDYGMTLIGDNCTLSDSIKVNVLNDSYCSSSSYGFPNVLTPNGDAMNDIFEPLIGQDLLNQDWTGAKLKIYNRWGVKVYESPDNAYPIWDVRNEVGDVATSSTYFYTFQPPGENAPMVNGFVLVVNEL